MDKKNTFIGILCVIGAFGLMFYQGNQVQDIREETAEVAPTEQEAPAAPEKVVIPAPVNLVNEGLQRLESSAATSVVHTLENDFVQLNIDSQGGALHAVNLKQYPRTIDGDVPFVFNEVDSLPVMSLSTLNENGALDTLDFDYKVVSQDDYQIVLAALVKPGVKIVRTYQINEGDGDEDPYVIKHETKIVNRSNEPLSMGSLVWGLGSLPPTKGDTFGDYLNVGYYNGDKCKFIKLREFTGSKGMLGIGKKAPKAYALNTDQPLTWGSVKNQFFTSVLTPSEPAAGIYATSIPLGDYYGDGEEKFGVRGGLIFNVGTIEAGADKKLSMSNYVGPKEFTRLNKLGQDQDKVMQFGWFGFLSKILLIMMKGIHSFIPNWGVTIILVTMIIKLLLWPLTAMQLKSSRKMTALQAPLKIIKEKYKDNPQKSQMETMKLFKEHKVNPAAGCLPIFIQIPIFLALYFMLRTSSELRFASFLWISDLSLPDTIMHLGSFPLNILPLIMGVTMYFQMKLSPSPSTDEFQKKLFEFMPLIFLFFCYHFPSGLVLYWTSQNLLTIAQQAVMKKGMAEINPVVFEEPKKAASKKKRIKKKK